MRHEHERLSHRSAKELAEWVRTKKVSPVEIVRDVLDAIEEVQPVLHPFLALDAELALARARAAEKEALTADRLGPLHGVPVAVKDLEMTTDFPSSSGARAFADYRPEADSILVERVRASGAIIVGKTNTPAFGLLGETKNRLGPATGNPWNPGRTAGGSSGGSAAAVGSGCVPIGTGTDSAGSITCPAAMCGVFGLKPTHGRVPMYPNSGDSLLFNDGGPLARTVDDAALLLSALSGGDHRDPVSLAEPPQDYVSRFVDVGDLRVAGSVDFGHFAVDREIGEIVESGFRRASELVAAFELATPSVPNPWEIYTPLYVTDMRLSLAAFVEEHPDDIYPDTLEELASVDALSAEQYVAHLHELHRFRGSVRAFFERFDILLTAATAVVAFPHDAPPSEVAGRPVPAGWMGFMPLQITWNMTGQPVANIPVGFTAEGLPVGMLAIARHGREDQLLSFCAAFEAAYPWPAIADAFTA